MPLGAHPNSTNNWHTFHFKTYTCTRKGSLAPGRRSLLAHIRSDRGTDGNYFFRHLVIPHRYQSGQLQVHKNTSKKGANRAINSCIRLASVRNRLTFNISLYSAVLDQICPVQRLNLVTPFSSGISDISVCHIGHSRLQSKPEAFLLSKLEKSNRSLTCWLWLGGKPDFPWCLKWKGPWEM